MSLTRLAPGQFFGEPKSSISVDGLLFQESTYAANVDLPQHLHAQSFFNFVLEGTSIQVDARGAHTRSPSTLGYYPAGYVHANRWPEEGRLLHIELAPRRIELLREYAPLLDRPSEVHGGVPAALAMRAYHEYRRRDALSPLALEGLTLELIAETARRPLPVETRPPAWLLKVRELLHDRFAENLTLGEIGEAVLVHPSHLARTFRRHFGCTLGDFVRRLRLDYVCKQLTATDRKICLIAPEAGFTDQSHLTKAFKDQIGTTPAQFRAIARQRKSSTSG